MFLNSSTWLLYLLHYHQSFLNHNRRWVCFPHMLMYVFLHNIHQYSSQILFVTIASLLQQQRPPFCLSLLSFHWTQFPAGRLLISIMKNNSLPHRTRYFSADICCPADNSPTSFLFVFNFPILRLLPMLFAPPTRRSSLLLSLTPIKNSVSAN